MNKVKLLIVVSSGLLLANVILIGLFLLRPNDRPGDHRMQEPKWIIIQKLDLDKTQQSQFEELIHIHQKAVRALNDSLNESRKMLMHTLVGDTAHILSDSIKNEIGDLLKKIETTRYEHFSSIRKICRPDQLDAFNSLIEELPFLLSNGPGGPGRPQGPPPPELRD